MNVFNRTESLIGAEALNKLAVSKVAVFGLGGVGSYAVEALARCGVGALLLVDGDVVEETNVNRQLYALRSTIGKYKTDVAANRVLDINPSINIITKTIFYDEKTSDQVDFSGFDYVIDAIDTVSSKLLIIQKAKQLNVPVVSAMGTGNKLDASAFSIADISKTDTCPLARAMRRELKNRGIGGVDVLFSKEIPQTRGNRVASSVSFVPAAAGLLIAGFVIKKIIGVL